MERRARPRGARLTRRCVRCCLATSGRSENLLLRREGSWRGEVTMNERGDEDETMTSLNVLDLLARSVA